MNEKKPKLELSSERRKKISELIMKPEVTNNRAMLHYQDEPDEVCQLVELDRQCKAISSGDLSDPEAMLWSQAQLLNHVSSQFAKKLTDGAMSIEAFKTFSDIMLRAQNQTRRTLDSLANLKRPKVQVQQNICSHSAGE
jgi:hypothetical protein